MSTYDPSYCLNEHLTYFQENVASNIADLDFDAIFDECAPTYPEAPSSYMLIEKVFLVPNPISALAAKPEPVSDKSLPSTSCASPASPTSIRQFFNESAPNKESTPELANSEWSIETSAPTSNVPTPLAPSPLAITDDEATDRYSPVPPAAVSEDELCSQAGSVSIPVFPLPPLTTSRESCTSAPKKISRKRRSSDGPEVRRERNRRHAKKSRERKREFHQCLQDSVAAFKEENARLLAILNERCHTNGEQPVQVPRLEEEDRFIACLQRPESRTLSDESLADLQSLFN